ncbi:MAG: CAP domain-containing protein [Flavobacteriaceae bacterium]|nr:CAP domain-containing protein [Flavobacteriaceae bacterium]
MKSPTINLIVLLSITCFLLSCNKNDNDFETVNIEAVYFNSLENEILSLVNFHRESIGLHKVSTLNQPYTEATNHTKYMIQQGKTSHDNFDIRSRNLMAGSSARVILENVAAGYLTAESVMKQWFNSASHRAVIENPEVQYMGISAQKDSQGSNYYTQIFIGK